MVPTHTLNPLPFRPGVKRARVDQGPHSEAKRRNVGICALVATEESAPPKAQVHETAYCCILSKIFAKKEESHGEKRVFPCSPVWYPPIPSTLAIPTERKASARSNRGPRHARFCLCACWGELGAHIPKRSIGMWERARS